jgi:predicted ArsR family transcriptional regulator
MASHDEALEAVEAPGLGETQRRILSRLKRAGTATVDELAAEVQVAAETVREHLNALAGRGLVRRAGARREGPGRPRILYALTGEAAALFPSEEARLLRELAVFLREDGREDALAAFFEARRDALRRAAEERLAGLEGRARLAAMADLLGEQGFMAEVGEEEGEPLLRLCHCPLRELVEVSRLPCRSELAWIRDALGEPLSRRSYMPDGDHVCAYAVG